MQIRNVLGLIATVVLLTPQEADGQAPSLSTFFAWGYGWHNYATYGGGALDDMRPGGALETHSFGQFQNGITAQEGRGTGQASFGFLTASAEAYATAQSPSIWNDAWVRQSTETMFHDILTVLSDGQLNFGLLMHDALSTTGTPEPGCGTTYSGFFGNHCARAAARFSIWGAVNAGIEVGHNSLSGATTASASSGVINVVAGQVLEIRGSFIVGGTTCEHPDGGYCNVPTGAYSTSFASGSARFFVDETGGADYSSLSGTQYASSTAVVATPEPSSVILLATGLLGIAAAARRRKGDQPVRCSSTKEN